MTILEGLLIMNYNYKRLFQYILQFIGNMKRDDILILAFNSEHEVPTIVES